MSTKDKENTLHKLKQFFRIKTPGSGFKDKTDFGLTPELEKELMPETPVAQRCRALKDLGDVVLTNRLDELLLKKLWDLTKDLIVPSKPAEQRQTALLFYSKLIQGQYESLSLMRSHFFRVIQDHNVPEDTFHRLELLKSLTDNGKDITNFEEELGKFMLQWAHTIVLAGLTESYLEMLDNVIKFNAAYLDKEIVVGIVQNACHLCCYFDDSRTGLQSLSVLHTVICYAIFPNETLTLLIGALCRTVNREVYCQTSWKIMRDLLGTNLGHASLLTMCNILNDRNVYDDEALLRGAVFHINMGLWGSPGSLSPMLKCTPSTVLLSFFNALKSQHVTVTYEVVLSIQRLIQNYGQKLSEPSWDVICDIMKAIADNLVFYERNGQLIDNAVKRHFHETLDDIENMTEKDKIIANHDIIYGVIEKVADDRPELSVLHLMDYLSNKISAMRPQWIQSLNYFMERFYKMKKTNIRVKAVLCLKKIMENNRAAYEEEILERIVIPHLSNIAQDQDIAVRIAVTKILIEFTYNCDTKRCSELLDIIGKILNRPFENYANDGIIVKKESEVQDLIIAVEGLIQIFLVKLYRLPSQHAISIYYMLVEHIEQQYEFPKILEAVGIIRFHIFHWILKARANATLHIGYADPTNNNIKFSHYLRIEGPYSFLMAQSQQSSSDATSTISFTAKSIRRGCKTIVKCLEQEKDWPIIQLVLKELPLILQNKALIQGNDVDLLAKTLYKMFFDKSVVDSFIPTTVKPSTSDLHALVLPALASLTPYHQFLDPFTQKRIIEALKNGLFRIPKVCVQALTVMILEMPDTLLKSLPEVLLEMSKMSNTVNVAVPVLEFLSTLNRLPNHRFASFVTLQYMYVFAISLPYTNPYKYDHYTVSLAHHVIAGWFLKCRLPLRRNFVNYIIAGLETNVHTSFQDIKSKAEFAPVNEDSSNRKRSSSLTEQGSKRRERATISAQRPKADIKTSLNDELYNFHMELADTCVDFMARHTFSPCSALPKRLPTADFLLSGGQSQTWLVGHNLVTITTSGCSASPLRNGLCERCSVLCKALSQQTKHDGTSSAMPMSPESTISSRTDTDSQNKRYTKASLQHSANESESTDLTSSASSSVAFSQQQQLQTTQLGTKFFRQSSSDGRFSSSSGSLEALSRRGSNPDTPDNYLDHSNINKSESSISYISTNVGNTLTLPQMPTLGTPQPTADRPRQLCACSCTGWAEICIRRPTGSISWIMRIQNQISYDSFTNEFPLHELTSLFMPSLSTGIQGTLFNDKTNISSSTEKIAYLPQVQTATEILNETKLSEVTTLDTASEINNLDNVLSTKEITENISLLKNSEENISAASLSGPIDIPGQIVRGKEADENSDGEIEDEDPDVNFDDIEARSRNPVRRVNSSPEMSSNWRNPFLNQKVQTSMGSNNATASVIINQDHHDDYSMDIDCQQKKKNFGKDMRVSCEAIPEEMAGSTPPSLTGSVKDSVNTEVNTKIIMASTVAQQTDFAAQSANLLGTAILHSSSSLPDQSDGQTVSTQQIAPRKQHSADEALESKVQQSAEILVPDQSIQNKQTSSTAGVSINLKLPIEIQKITTKPPQSPAPLSPRLTSRNNMNAPSFNNTNNGINNDSFDVPRGRSKTISVVSRDYSRDKLITRGNTMTNRTREQSTPSITRSGISPSFVFLQLYNTGQLNVSERPLRVDTKHKKAITLLDLIPPFETHKIGVLYVGPGQCNNETEILKNRFGSLRYAEFLRNLGTLVAIKDAKEHNLFINMESNGKDGNFTYIWQDDIVQVTFHVATLMPNNEQDPNCNEKKKHIGNDYVTIVYNESGDDYNLNTIKGQFNYACVIVQPQELSSNRIFIRTKDDIKDYICHNDPKIVSDNSAPLLARQLALHCNLASLVAKSLKTKNQSPYASNFLERLRKIKHLKSKLVSELDQPEQGSGTGNFTGSNNSSSSSSNNTTNDISSYKKPYKGCFTEYTQ